MNPFQFQLILSCDCLQTYINNLMGVECHNIGQKIFNDNEFTAQQIRFAKIKPLSRDLFHILFSHGSKFQRQKNHSAQ